MSIVYYRVVETSVSRAALLFSFFMEREFFSINLDLCKEYEIYQSWKIYQYDSGIELIRNGQLDKKQPRIQLPIIRDL